FEKAKQTASWYQEVFGRDHYYMEIQAHGIPEQARVTAETLRIAQAIGAPVVGTNDSHYLEAGHGRAHEALLCIQTGSTLADPGRWKFSTEEFYVKSAEEMALGFAGYFLFVWDFIHYARQAGIAVGPGRGSSAGSLVAYCLGITNIDPMRYGLLFERFLNPERVSMPDMDIDFADDRRDEVIRYVADKYGRDRVAHIITFGTLGAKAAIRDVGRVLGMTYTEV